MRNCIVYLIRGDEGSLCQFAKSLKLLKRNFLPWSPADVILFHEGNISEAKLQGRTSGIPVCLAKVDFTHVPSELANVPPKARGYRHMCHFFSNDIFLRKELDKYDYYMRLDDDSFILSPLKYNVFDRMRARAFKYAYRAIVRDKAYVCTDLWPLARAYLEENVSCVRPPESIPELNMYYTNFEVCDIKWFRGRAYQDFFKMIDSAGGIWKYRWGDAPIRYLGVQGLLHDAEIWCVKDMHYFHQSEWRSGFQHRLPWDYVKYAYKMTIYLLRQRFFGKT